MKIFILHVKTEIKFAGKNLSLDYTLRFAESSALFCTNHNFYTLSLGAKCLELRRLDGGGIQ
jgi:hypothetical protein